MSNRRVEILDGGLPVAVKRGQKIRPGESTGNRQTIYIVCQRCESAAADMTQDEIGHWICVPCALKGKPYLPSER